MRRSLAAIVVVLGLAASPGLSYTVDTGFFPACTAPAGVACTDLFIDSFDATLLDSTLYVPSAATPATPQPAVLMTHGYGGWHRGGGDAAFARLIASKGYVVLAYTSRGFGRSTGQVQLDSPDYEVRDARALLTWLATPSNTGGAVLLDGPGDPRAGMVGGSYAGGIQLLTASYDARLDAITPQITWNDLRYSLSPNGVIKHGWIDLLYASGKYAGYFGPLGSAPPPVVGTDGVPTDQDLQVLSSYLANDSVEMPVAYSDGSKNSYEYLKRRSPTFASVIENIRAATLLVQGQRDTLFWVNEALANLGAIADNGGGTPAKLVVFSGGHGWPDLPGERDAINARIFTWFDRHLRGLAVSTGAAVEVWDPQTPGANFVAFASGLPAPATTLSWAGPVTLANPLAPTSHSEVTNFQSSTNTPSQDGVGGATTAALAAPGGLRVAGVPVARFRISATAPEAIVFVKLWDVDASGARTLVHHLVTPARVRAGTGDFCSQITPGPPSAVAVANVDVCLPLAATVWTWGAGHTLEMSVSTTDSTHFGSRFPSVTTISNLSLALPTY